MSLALDRLGNGEGDQGGGGGLALYTQMEHPAASGCGASWRVEGTGAAGPLVAVDPDDGGGAYVQPHTSDLSGRGRPDSRRGPHWRRRPACQEHAAWLRGLRFARHRGRRGGGVFVTIRLMWTGVRRQARACAGHVRRQPHAGHWCAWGTCPCWGCAKTSREDRRDRGR